MTSSVTPDIDLSAGLISGQSQQSKSETFPRMDLSAGLVPNRSSSEIDLSAGLVPNTPDVEATKLPPEIQNAVSRVSRPAPPVALTPGNRYVAAPNQETPEVRLGNMVPQGAVPALAAAKKYAVDPFEKMAAKGASVGGELAERALFATPPTPFQPSPAFNKEAVEKEFPITSGIARGVGGVAGGTVADPRNWPFFASGAARPLLQRLISGGFGTQMTAGAVDAAKNLYHNWDKLSPSQRAELATQGGLTAIMATGSVSHALSPTAPAVEVRPTRAELAEHLDRTNFHSPEAARASWTAEQQTRQAPVASHQEVLAPGPVEESTPGKTASQWRAERQTTGPVDYDVLARQNGAVSSTPPATQPVPKTEAANVNFGTLVAQESSSNATPPQVGSGPNQFADRRANVSERKRIAEMSPEEMKKELLTSPVTGMPNRRAFDEAGPAKAVAMSDADGLKAFNDKFGYHAGNALLRAKADALKAAGLDAYHEKGDEFLYRGTSTADLQSKLESARQTFRNMIIEATLPDGTVKYLKGVDFSYGTGEELSDAETALKAHKSEREVRGERVRGGLPGVAEVSQGNAIPVPAAQGQPAPEVAQPRSELSLRVVPGARSAATGNETGTTSIQDLTESISRQVGEKRPLKERLRAGADIGEAAASAKDAVGSSLARLKGGAAALWDAYSRSPKWTYYEDATGKWSGADQANALDLERFTKAIKDAVPDKLKREAISNWIEAGGDEDVLTERTAKSAAPHRAGYEAALNLTDAERTIARNIMNRNDATLEEAQRAGLLQQGVENYVRHIYADNPKMVAKVAAEMNFNSLQTKPSFTKQRKLPTYFDAEQLGFKPKDKDVGFLTASHERAFREALAARDYVKSLMEGKASDGRPLVATSWASAKELPAAEGKKSAAYLVKPNIRAEEEFADYRRIDHPALRGWRWAGKTDAGAPIFVQGDALVHPEIYAKLKNNLGKSAVRSFQVDVAGQTFRPGAALLNVSSEIKHAILSFSAFHQTTLGIHALEHRTKPFGMPDLDLSEPKQRSLVDHGLMVAQYDAMEAFGEGLASGGLVTKIPVVGPAYHAYIDYLFKDYLPRVKMAMALNALERNTRLYGEKLSGDQLAALTARQANAAFGGLNYKMLGRNKTLQDVMRLSFMAPDFTEARVRFAGQAARPYGREQLTALVGGALAFYTAGRILNQMVDDDPRWDKPFSLVHGGKEYRLRTVQGDLWSATSEPKQYVRNRLSPLASTAVRAAEGRNQFGRKESLTDLGKDLARSNVPIPLQPWTKNSDDPLARKAFGSILKMIGVNESVSRTKAEKMAGDIAQSYIPDRTMSPAERARHQLRKQIIEEGEKGDWRPLYDARAHRLFDQEEVRQIRHDVQLGPLAARVNHFKYADFMKVFSVATPEEQRQLDLIRLRKRADLLKGGKRAEVTQAEIQ
jgi:GGDEF domain-containing protein